MTRHRGHPNIEDGVGLQKGVSGARSNTTVFQGVQGGGRTIGPLFFGQIHLADRRGDRGLSQLLKKLKVKQTQIDQGEREGLTTEEREELERLRRENRVLKQERDFLKKAAAFFAREDGTR